MDKSRFMSLGKEFAHIIVAIIVSIVIYEILSQYVWKNRFNGYGMLSVYCALTWSFFFVFVLLISYLV